MLCMLTMGGAQVLELSAMGTRHWQITACSAVTGQGLLDGIDWTVNDVRNRRFLLG